MNTSVAERMPYTAAYPELGTGPIDVEPLISEELFELERERIFKRAWLKVGRIEELPEPGCYKVKRIEVARTSALIMRGRDGVIRAFHNVCTHRGNKVVQERGDETFGRARAHGLTCRFHAWTFNTDGSLRAVAKEDKFADLDKSRLGLVPIHCDVWEGFIFINLDDTPRWTLAEYLGGMGEHFAGFPYGAATYKFRYSAVLECNWKVSVYAFAEGYHVPTIHGNTLPSLAEIVHSDFKLFGPHSTSALFVGGLGEMEPTPVTGRLGGMLKGSQVHGQRLDDLPPAINPERRRDFHFEFPVFFPNFIMHVCGGSAYPGMVYFHHQFWPIAVGRTLWEGTNYFRPPGNAAERIAIAHTNALHRNAWLEDTGTMEDTYEALRSGVLRQMPLMDEEIMIRNTHKHWHDFMRAV
jgi:nitrite reductase/ring-hydroxylating ferredoxin subunit